jgi:hypothetical protein
MHPPRTSGGGSSGAAGMDRPPLVLRFQLARRGDEVEDGRTGFTAEAAEAAEKTRPGRQNPAFSLT